MKGDLSVGGRVAAFDRAGSPSSPLRVLVSTNVRQPIVAAYLYPLLELPEIAEVVLVRDRADVSLSPKLKIVSFPRWWPHGFLSKLLARRVLLRWTAARYRPDVLMLLHWFPDGPAVVRRGRAWGIPVVVNIIGGPAELIDGGRGIALSRLARWIGPQCESYQRRHMNQAAAITFTGERTRQWFQRAGVNRPSSHVFHAAPRVPEGPTSTAERNIDITFIGRLHADKRIDRLFRVVAELDKRRPGTAVRVIGMTHDEVQRMPEYRAAVAQLGTRLELYRHVENVDEVLGRTKVLLLTSDTEGRTLAVLEALANGAAVVTTDVGDLAEALLGGRAGILAPLGDEEEAVVERLVAAASRLLEDETLRSQMAAVGNAFVRETHSRHRARNDWRSVLQSIGKGVTGS